MSSKTASKLGDYRKKRVSHPLGLPGVQILLGAYGIGETVTTAELVTQAEKEKYTERQVYGAISSAVHHGWLEKVLDETRTYRVCAASKEPYKAKWKPNMPAPKDEGSDVL
ncbi:hypothetical protein [Levilactobacillus yiduensis]|uniref:hypothetical protein n=1 Tax=Levilactobacillus yiduensis TaxID=2953880 RepID=UPI000EF3364F|nr:hypothetical protein [Levilactobacillus yiduensis]AYM01493.1 hypothetical protein D8911_00245 [Levilactobacillus brevis]